jgi:hypothetical protein
MPWSRSRCVCSTYSFVFFGTASGMSCSGGGPVLDPTFSSDDVRGRILIERPPDFITSTSVLSSRANLPKRSPVTMPSSCARPRCVLRGVAMMMPSSGAGHAAASADLLREASKPC